MRLLRGVTITFYAEKYFLISFILWGFSEYLMCSVAGNIFLVFRRGYKFT